MDKKLKSILKFHIESYLQKTPHASDGKIIKWLYIGAVPGPDTLNAIKIESLRSFVVYQKKKFAMHGFCADHLKGNGRPSVPGRKIALSVYGRRVRNDRKWGKIINTDFSAKITTLLPETQRMMLFGASQENLLATCWMQQRRSLPKGT